jgi:hypothetical protein
MATPEEDGMDLPCGVSLASCQCVKEAGHVVAGDDVHTCRWGCGGSWRGRGEDDPAFEVVTYPGGFTSMGAAMLNYLMRGTS